MVKIKDAAMAELRRRRQEAEADALRSYEVQNRSAIAALVESMPVVAPRWDMRMVDERPHVVLTYDDVTLMLTVDTAPRVGVVRHCSESGCAALTCTRSVEWRAENNAADRLAVLGALFERDAQIASAYCVEHGPF